MTSRLALGATVAAAVPQHALCRHGLILEHADDAVERHAFGRFGKGETAVSPGAIVPCARS